MRAADTPIGKAVVLPPLTATSSHVEECAHDIRVGDTVDVEEECPTCEGCGMVQPIDCACSPPWADCTHPPDRCQTCFGERAVSVPHVVTEVLPIRSQHPVSHLVASYALVLPDGQVQYWGDRTEHHGAIFDLPDAVPGGVVLVVERGEAPS